MGVAEQREPDWPAHEARAGYLADTFQPCIAPFSEHLLADWDAQVARHRADQARERAWEATVRAAPDEVAASLALLLIRRAATAEPGPSQDACRRLPRVLGRRDVVVPGSDAAWAVRAAVTLARHDLPGVYDAGLVMVAAAALAARCAEPAEPCVQDAAAALADVVDRRWGVPAADADRIRRYLRAIRPVATEADPLDTSLIKRGDGWSAAVLGQLAGWPEPAGAANVLLRHLCAATSSRPTATWLRSAANLLRDAGAARLVQVLVEGAATAEPAAMDDGSAWRLLVSHPNAGLVRAACWSASSLAADWTVPALHAIARRSILGSYDVWEVSAKVPHGCILALGAIATDPAIAALDELRRAVRHAGFRKQIDAALAGAAARAGISPGELAERAVPDAGLDGNAERHIRSGTFMARIRIDPRGGVLAEWRASAGWVRRRPAGADSEAVGQVKLAVREVKAAVAGERGRLEGLLAADRSWAVSEWQRRYLGHPVTRGLAVGLIWEFGTSSGVTVAGMPAGGDEVDTPGGLQAIPADATVRLWHPARAGTEQVRAWRDHLVATGRVQPFKQAFREIYLLTPAERSTRLYSNRFASHILRYQQAYALYKERGWKSNYLGPHDGGHEGHAQRSFPEAGLVAMFDHYPVGDDPDAPRIALCSTDRVSFWRAGDRSRAPVPLQDVPDLVFSEAMRDVDLFVSVTSIALDPHWADEGEDQYLAYWHEYSFGELGQTAAMRREALQRLIPKLKIAPRLELTDRHVLVRGRLRGYKIHIGSGHVLAEPDDRYLCIVPGRSSSTVMLPFDGDQILSVILSKAVMLAADDKITDPAILGQLRPGLSPSGA